LTHAERDEAILAQLHMPREDEQYRALGALEEYSKNKLRRLANMVLEEHGTSQPPLVVQQGGASIGEGIFAAFPHQPEPQQGGAGINAAFPHRLGPQQVQASTEHVPTNWDRHRQLPSPFQRCSKEAQPAASSRHR
jgi:hypothetical protein